MNRKQRRRLEKQQALSEKSARKRDEENLSVDALLARAGELFGQGRALDSLDLCQKAADLEPENFGAQSNLGNVLADLGKIKEAEAAYQSALGINPNAVPVLTNLALLKAETGDPDGASALYRRVLEIDPTDAETFHDLSLLKKFPPGGDADMSAMEALRGRSDLAPEKAMFLDFALAKAHDDAGDYDRAFGHMAAANRGKRQSLNYDPAGQESMADRIINVFDEAFVAGQAGAGSKDERPVFIIGMPRSGTTLVEQILASHSGVRAMGEVNYFRDAVYGFAGEAGNKTGVKGMSASGKDFPEGVLDMGEQDFKRLGNAYMALLTKDAGDAVKITDKVPRNFFFAGLISMALPHARIIHCRRNPVDTCLSCFHIHFPEGQEFSYDLSDLGRYYRLYARLMDHWKAVLGSRVFDIAYEDLVADPEPVMRGLLDFAGLDWEEACLDFHKSARQVRTASSHQVRRPVYKSAVQRWRNYQAHLGPLLDALGPLVDTGTKE